MKQIETDFPGLVGVYIQSVRSIEVDAVREPCVSHIESGNMRVEPIMVLSFDEGDGECRAAFGSLSVRIDSLKNLIVLYRIAVRRLFVKFYLYFPFVFFNQDFASVDVKESCLAKCLLEPFPPSGSA